MTPLRLPSLRRRRGAAPDDVRALALPAGERRVAWARTEDGQPVVATDGGLLLPGGTHLLWSDVERAAWRPPELLVLGVAEVEGTGPRHLLRLAEEGTLPEVVHTRVLSSVAWSVHHGLTPAGGVRLVGRRVAGEEVLRWQVVFDAGTDRDDPLVRAQADQRLDEVRRSVG